VAVAVVVVVAEVVERAVVDTVAVVEDVINRWRLSSLCATSARSQDVG